MSRVELKEADDIAQLRNLLFDALPDIELLYKILERPDVTSYTAWSGQKLVGAIAVMWGRVSEIELLAVVDRARGKGFGKAIVKCVVDEARTRQARSLLVGTGNFAVGNIIFYQKCGFRMSSIRRDHFPPTQPPIMNRGIVLSDMLVFEYPLLDIRDQS